MFKGILSLLAGPLLFAFSAPPLLAAPEGDSQKKSSTAAKKKSTTGTGASKKKTPAADADADAPSTTARKKTSNEDLPLPSKTKASGGTGEPKTASPEKKSSAAARDEPAPSKTAAKASVEKVNAEKDKSEVQTAPAEDKPAGTAAVDPATKREHAENATVEPEAIAEFSAQPPRIQKLIRDALDLTRQNLTYTFGSAEPTKGGMDCSGTMYYLLRSHGFTEVPRDSAGQYIWARKVGAFYPVLSKNADGPEFDQLKPGDLMFWTGTYETQRDVPISHVMLYLGREKGSKKRIMFGASDGRSYNGVQRWGVSVFDFKMPKTDPANPEKAKVDFVGYARIPGLRDAAESVAAVAAEEPPKSAEAEEARAAGDPQPKSKSASVVSTDAAEEKATPRPKSSSTGKAKTTTKSSTGGSKQKKGTSSSRKAE